MFHCPAKSVQIKMFKFVKIRVSYKDSAIKIIAINNLLSFLLSGFYVLTDIKFGIHLFRDFYLE